MGNGLFPVCNLLFILFVGDGIHTVEETKTGTLLTATNNLTRADRPFSLAGRFGGIDC